MGKTISELILSAKSESDVHAGDIVVAQVDLAFVQDTTGPLTVRQFRAAKFKKTADSLESSFISGPCRPQSEPGNVQRPYSAAGICGADRRLPQ